MLDIKRREFIALIGGGCLLLAVKVKRAWGQQPAKIPRIGILDDTPRWQPFRQALRELGYVEGQNIAYEYRYGEGAPNRLATVAAELVRRPVDLIATYGTQATQAAKEATVSAIRCGSAWLRALPDRAETSPATPCSVPTSVPNGCKSCARPSGT